MNDSLIGKPCLYYPKWDDRIWLAVPPFESCRATVGRKHHSNELYIPVFYTPINTSDGYKWYWVGLMQSTEELVWLLELDAIVELSFCD